MNWNERILSDEELQPWLKEKVTENTAEHRENAKDLSPSSVLSVPSVAAPAVGTAWRWQVRALIAQQQATWPMLRRAADELARVETKRLNVRGVEVIAQFNPARIVSTAAKVDAATIQARPCFLCPDNLPAEEKGIAFGADYVALCNPFPVLPDHLVIAARAHTPQTIIGNFGALLDLAQVLGKGWFVLYNGPRCGASAPDHLHFQACAAELPVLRAPEAWPFRILFRRDGNRAALLDWFEQTLSPLRRDEQEPMINIVATFAAQNWTVIIYPRRQHRPARYDAPEPRRLTVSPAAIDLSGVVVVPQPEHFARINAEDVEEIFAEVLL